MREVRVAQAKNTKKTASLPVPSAGELWAIPLTGLGYAPVVVARVPAANAEVDLAFVYLRLSLTKSLPKVENLPPLGELGEAWIGLVSTLAFRKKRWVRCGEVRKFDASAWPVPPSRRSDGHEPKPGKERDPNAPPELWSIETTADEPTMTVIDNVSATREEALRFPETDVVIGASHLEKGLSTYFKKRTPSFWDMELLPQRITSELLSGWIAHANAVRSRNAGIQRDWLPAGRTTDKKTRPGAWMGMPLLGGGFGAAILIDRPAKELRVFSDTVVMAMRRKWDRWPTIEDVRSLRPEDGALVAQTSFICVRDGRWRVIGEHPAFDPGEWVWPRPWFQSLDNKKHSVIEVSWRSGDPIKIQVPASLLAQDPYSGYRCRGSSSYGSFESSVPRIMDGTEPGLKDEDSYHIGIVTPQRIKAWRAINAVIEKALSEPTK